MKKNITINMFGVLYNIDEDAYELLHSYLDGMKAYFTRHGADSEIAEDIEYRVAELLAELKAQGREAINIEDVRAICARVGEPEQMECDDAEDAAMNEADTASDAPAAGSEDAGEQTQQQEGDEGNAPETSRFEGTCRRRLYRDGRDMMLGGVLGGLTKFLGLHDAMPLRIAFAVCVFFMPYAMLLYLPLWALLPVARTAEDRLRQKGYCVTASNVQAELLADSTPPSQGLSTTGRDLVNGILSIIVWIFKVGLLLVLGFVALVAMMVVCVAVPVAVGLLGTAMYAALFGLVLLIVAVAIPIVAAIHALFTIDHWSARTRIFLIMLWILAVMGAILCLGESARQAYDHDMPEPLPSFQYFWNNAWDIDDDEPQAAEELPVDTVAADTSVVRVNVKDDKELPEDGAVEVFPEDAP